MMAVALFLILLTLGHRVSSYWNNEYDRPLHHRCPSGQAVYWIASYHSNHYRDRLWKIACRPAATSFSRCSWSGSVNKFDQHLFYTCPNNHVIAGVKSYHSNYYEDRRWEFLCCESPRLDTHDCRWTGYVNDLGRYFFWSVPTGYYMRGVDSYHSNRKEDRRWDFYYCKGEETSVLTCYTGDGRDYRGTVAKTISGKTCQRWLAQSPHKHNRTPARNPDKGLEENYCRNPDGERMPWCYTTDPEKRWEDCPVPRCDEAPCGVPSIRPRVKGYTSRIVNGQNAVSGSWPWQVSLQYNSGFHFCGGSLINKYWVVTAAHCKVIPGSHRVILDRKSSREQTISISKTIPHPNYNPKASLSNDVRLVKLSSPARYTSRVSPVCLSPSSLSLPAETRCVSTGWGRIKYSPRKYPRFLQQAVMPLLSNAQCKQTYGGNSITDSMICAGASGATDCRGDSGGPLVCERGGVWTLVGISSFGSKSCSGRYPAVYARVSKVRRWIDQTVRSN